MKIAIVVDDLIQKGGQEVLLSALSDVFPSAPIYTLQVSDYWKQYYSNKNVKIVTSFIQNLPWAQKLNRYYFFTFVHILGFESFDFSEYEIVISVSSRFANFIITKPTIKHIAYINSPGRMFWESHSYFESENFGILKWLSGFAPKFLSLPLMYIRQADYIASQKIDYILANSINIQKKILKYYKRESAVVYPFVDVEKLQKNLLQTNSDDYFLVITRLVAWKRVDIVVEACTKLGLKLKIIGEGPDIERLRKIAGPTVEFLGRCENDKLKVLSSCKALIHPQYEDFGIVPLEAMLAGKPVLAFSKGGALETIIKGVTGDFFSEQTSQSLELALKSFNVKNYDSQKCVDRAKEFDIKNFAEKILLFVQLAYARLKKEKTSSV